MKVKDLIEYDISIISATSMWTGWEFISAGYRLSLFKNIIKLSSLGEYNYYLTDMENQCGKLCKAHLENQ